MNKGVANMWRYFQVGIGANLRYLDALAAAPLKGEGVEALDTLCRSRTPKTGVTTPASTPSTPQDLSCSEPSSPAPHHRRIPQQRSRQTPLPAPTPQHSRRSPPTMCPSTR